MKAIRVAIVIGLFVSAHNSLAGRCEGVAAPPPGAAVTCVPVTDVKKAVVNPQDAERLERDLRMQTADDIAKNCTPNGKSEVISMISGSLCGKNVKDHRVCHYIVGVDCKRDDKLETDLKVIGACVGDTTDCGTFESCVKDLTLKTKFEGVKFRAPAAKAGGDGDKGSVTK